MTEKEVGRVKLKKMNGRRFVSVRMNRLKVGQSHAHELATGVVLGKY